MESRNIALTLEKAREWYNSGSADLKEIALQAYTKDELTIPEWQNIKTFEDACKALSIRRSVIDCSLIPSEIAKHMVAICRLDIIRKALNGDWKPSLVQGSVYYPYVRFYPAGQKAREAVSEHKEWKLGESFIADGKKYTLVGGGYRAYVLGREKETIPQEDIENAAKKYAAEVDKNVRDLYGIEEQPASLTFGECAAESFREGVKFALGKQEKDADTVIQGWVAIDEAFNQCFLHTEKPIQKAQPIADTGDYDTVWDSNGKTYLIDEGLFSDMDSDSEPQEVEIIIRRKKNG